MKQQMMKQIQELRDDELEDMEIPENILWN